MQKIGPIVSTTWLSKVLAPGSKTIRVLHGFKKPAGSKKYIEAHIPGALPFDINECSDSSSPYLFTLPSAGRFADYVGHLGIDNDTHVVVYDANPEVGMFASPRVWWMFRTFGHPKVSVLDGGFNKWVSEGHPVSSLRSEVEKTEFKARFQPQMLKKYEDMVSNVKNTRFQVMDARGFKNFMAEEPEQQEHPYVGHIPNSVNVPHTLMFKEGSALFKDPEELAQVFKDKRIDFDKPLAASCNSGIAACIIFLGAHVAGHQDLALFDGSWEEYGQRGPSELVAPNKGRPVGG